MLNDWYLEVISPCIQFTAFSSTGERCNSIQRDTVEIISSQNLKNN